MDNRIFSREQLKKLIIPLIIEQVLALTVGMIDAIMVSSAGESAMSGVSLVDAIAVLIINLFAAFAAGGAIIAGIYIGAKDKKQANFAATQLVNIIFIISIIITIICLILNETLLRAVFGEVDREVMKSAVAFFYMTILSFPFIALFNAGAALFRSMGNSKVSMINALIMNVVNFIGNLIFIYGCHWGAFGSGLATLIARFIAAMAVMIMLRNATRIISVRSYKFWKLDFSMVKRILGIGLPNGLENCFFQLGKLILISYVATMGTSSIAANGVAQSLAGIQVIPAVAMGFAITTVVAQCVGAGDYPQAKFYIKRLLKMAYLCIFFLNILIIAVLIPILSVYHLSGETLSLAHTVLLIHGISAIFLWPMAFALPSAFRSAGDVKYPMVISIISMIIFRIGGAYLIGHFTNLGLIGVWIAMPIDWLFRTFCFIWRYKRGKWQKF
ncbi:MAG: MATE family efflux transporter [Clostridiales Family XIII bacterium]|jgi:putative MATE family efflux protein|nr:MATE family efflux transporter [Clostridiales Family XIII bacterium]